MGRRYTIIYLLTRVQGCTADQVCLANILCTVLREIEEEEQLWKLREKPRSKEWRTKKKDATSDNNESPTDETTRSSKDSTTRRTTNKPPIKLVTASDQARNIDGGPTIPAVMREDDSAIEETRRKSPKFF